jgi:hypothetical protein
LSQEIDYDVIFWLAVPMRCYIKPADSLHSGSYVWARIKDFEGACVIVRENNYEYIALYYNTTSRSFEQVVLERSDLSHTNKEVPSWLITILHGASEAIKALNEQNEGGQ